MPRRLVSLTDVAPLLAPARSLYVSGCAAEIPRLETLAALGEGAAPLTISGIFLPGLNNCDYAAIGERTHCQTFFMTPRMATAEHGRVSYCPWRYREILRFYREQPPDAALVMLSPPDVDGYCSYGVAADFAPLVLPGASTRIGVINRQMPRTAGARIALDSLDAWLEIDQPLLETRPAAIDPVSERIAAHVASFIEDGATLQMGLGSIPGAVARCLGDRRKLRIRSGLIEAPILELDEAGALSAELPVLGGVALGDSRFYRSLDQNERVSFQPVSVTHDVAVIGATRSFIAINGALQVDLQGQVNSSVLPGGAISGPGGLPEFVSGALASRGGRSIIALNACTGGGRHSRIVDRLAGSSPSVSFADADVVVTEFGVAELRGKSPRQRALRLAAIADPRHREGLEQAALEYPD